jgi:hypothetical protein
MAYRKAQGLDEAEMTLFGRAIYPWPTGEFEGARARGPRYCNELPRTHWQAENFVDVRRVGRWPF